MLNDNFHIKVNSVAVLFNATTASLVFSIESVMCVHVIATSQYFNCTFMLIIIIFRSYVWLWLDNHPKWIIISWLGRSGATFRLMKHLITQSKFFVCYCHATECYLSTDVNAYSWTFVTVTTYKGLSSEDY